MKQKKLLTSLTALTIGALLFISACGGGNGGQAADSQAPATSETQATAAADSKADNAEDTAPADVDKGQYWLTDEKVTYSFLLPVVTDLNQFPFFQHLEEITNVHIDWITLQGDGFSSYVNLMWASGDMPDVIRGISDTDFALYAEQGQFFPINSIWESCMPNFMKILNEHPVIGRRLEMPDGNVYAMSGIGGAVIQAINGVWIYQPWLDKLGLEVPTTIDEFVKVLDAFKDSDPNGNGIQDEIPFAYSPAGWRQGQVHGWFGASQDWLIQKGVVSYSPITENYKEYVKFMNSLWTSGYLDQEVFTQDSATFGAKSTQDPVIYGVIMDYGLYITMPPNHYDDYTLLGPMETGRTPSGLLNTRGDMDYQLWGLNIISKNVKNPEILLGWFDVFCDPYYGAQGQYGMDGVHIKLNAKGIFEFIEEIPAPYQNREEWFLSTHYNQVMMYSATEMASILVADEVNIMEMREVFERFGHTFINEPLPAMTLQTWQEAEKLAAYPDINMLRDSKTPQWIAGVSDIDAEWDDYLNQMDQLGVKEYTAAYQEFYSRIAKQLGW